LLFLSTSAVTPVYNVGNCIPQNVGPFKTTGVTDTADVKSKPSTNLLVGKAITALSVLHRVKVMHANFALFTKKNKLFSWNTNILQQPFA
jgi:hypothetical protein